MKIVNVIFLSLLALPLVSCKKEPDMTHKGICLLTGKQRMVSLKYGGYMEYQKLCENGIKIWVTHKYTSVATREYYIKNNIHIEWQEAKIR